MRESRQESARIAVEYVTARSSRLRDAASADALEEASEHVYELVNGLSYLVVDLARRLAEAGGISVADVLQQEALTQVEGELLAPQTAREEVPIPDSDTQQADTTVGDPAPELVRIRRLQPPKQAAAFLEMNEEPDLLRPDEWTG